MLERAPWSHAAISCARAHERAATHAFSGTRLTAQSSKATRSMGSALFVSVTVLLIVKL